MTIRYNSEAEAAVYEDGAFRVELSALDSSEVRIWHRKSGIKIPPESWKIGEDGEATLDWSKLDDETAKKLDSDDDRLIASKIINVEGEKFESSDGVEKEWADIPVHVKPDIIASLRNEYPLFSVWCAQYIQGSKKKYGSVERVE